jgi:hypothetical protein
MDMKRSISPPAIFLLLLAPALAQQNTLTRPLSDAKELIGEYVYSSGFYGAYYRILSDARFEYSTFSDCCDPVWSESGSYALNGSILHCKVTTKTLNEFNLLDSKEASEAFQTIYGREPEPGEIKTEYDMQIVRWGPRIYLLKPLPAYVVIDQAGTIRFPTRTAAANNELTGAIETLLNNPRR